MKIESLMKSFLFGAAMMPLSSFAANPDYAPGDLVIYFQQEDGTNKTVMARLGNAATAFRGAAAGPGATDMLNIVNISAELTSAFGAGWASDPKIYVGLAGLYSNFTAEFAVNGDPLGTMYVSSSRSAAGTVGQASSPQKNGSGATQFSLGADRMNTMLNEFENVGLDGKEVLNTNPSAVLNANPFLDAGIQGTAFALFAGGVQQVGSASSFGTFGAAGNVEFALDLYRIVSLTGVSGQVAGVLRQGSYEGTVTVSAAGNVSFISQGAPGSAFDTWVGTFPALDTPAKKLKSADPESDGMTNLMEFVLNGNPGISDPNIAPVLDASGANFVFSFNRRDDSKTGNTLLFQYGSDLVGWTGATIGAASSVAGDATITVNPTTPVNTISVSVPKSVAPGGTLFGRLKVTSP